MKKALIILSIIVGISIVLGVIVFILFPQVIIVIQMAKDFSRSKHPELYAVLISREITQPSYYDYKMLSYLGINFKVPREGLTEKKERPAVVSLKFSGDKLFNIIKPLDNRGVALMLRRSLQREKPEDYEKIKLVFGEQALKSDYETYKFIN